MRGREDRMSSPLLGDDLSDLYPIITPGASDSACFDNVLELLVMAGRSLPHAMMMMIPEAFGSQYHISTDKRAFYEYHACLMEPCDGPASISFTDGTIIGAVLDRNGLRPSRYYVTHDDMIIMASEVGVLEVAPENVKIKERLHPGRILMVDMEQGRIIGDDELKKEFVEANRKELCQGQEIRCSGIQRRLVGKVGPG